jgi:hypothetical protein
MSFKIQQLEAIRAETGNPLTTCNKGNWCGLGKFRFCTFSDHRHLRWVEIDAKKDFAKE